MKFWKTAILVLPRIGLLCVVLPILLLVIFLTVLACIFTGIESLGKIGLVGLDKVLSLTTPIGHAVRKLGNQMSEWEDK